MPDLLAPEQRSGNIKIVTGQLVTVTASDIVVTGLVKVTAAVATLDSAPVLTCDRAQAVVPNQVTFPGTITVNTYMPTSSAVTTPIAATTFVKTVSWVAIGY